MFLIGTLLSLLFAALHWLIPEVVSLKPAIAMGQGMIFAIYPFALFTVYMAFCAPTFRPAVFTSVLMLCAAAFPFWLMYF